MPSRLSFRRYGTREEVQPQDTTSSHSASDPNKRDGQSSPFPAFRLLGASRVSRTTLSRVFAGRAIQLYVLRARATYTSSLLIACGGHTRVRRHSHLTLWLLHVTALTDRERTIHRNLVYLCATRIIANSVHHQIPRFPSAVYKNTSLPLPSPPHRRFPTHRSLFLVRVGSFRAILLHRKTLLWCRHRSAAPHTRGVCSSSSSRRTPVFLQCFDFRHVGVDITTCRRSKAVRTALYTTNPYLSLFGVGMLGAIP